MAVVTISLFVLCDDSCGGADHYPCLSCWKIVAAVAEMLRAWDTSTMCEATVCGRS